MWITCPGHLLHLVLPGRYLNLELLPHGDSDRALQSQTHHHNLLKHLTTSLLLFANQDFHSLLLFNLEHCSTLTTYTSPSHTHHTAAQCLSTPCHSSRTCTPCLNNQHLLLPDNIPHMVLPAPSALLLFLMRTGPRSQILLSAAESRTVLPSATTVSLGTHS